MPNFWMVRAGEGGYLAKNFEKSNVVAVGFGDVGDFRNFKNPEDLKHAIKADKPEIKPVALILSAGVATKFRDILQKGDKVITYDPEERQYFFGRIVSDYWYQGGVVPDYNHLRKVEWLGKVDRDDLTAASRNSLGSVITLFDPGDTVLQEVEGILSGKPAKAIQATASEGQEEEFAVLWKDTLGRSLEFIQDRILLLSADDMESLVAALLKSMGFKARVTPKGPDRGRDVIASPDGLGLTSPRIVAEVKHRPGTSMGAPEIRSFIGGLREGDRGLFISTGGFSKEAKYEADRANVPLTLVDLEDLARLVADNYEGFDAEGRALVPLVRVYWPR